MNSSGRPDASFISSATGVALFCARAIVSGTIKKAETTNARNANAKVDLLPLELILCLTISYFRIKFIRTPQGPPSFIDTHQMLMAAQNSILF